MAAYGCVVPHEYLSDEQARYGRFVADPTPEELEKFFFGVPVWEETAKASGRRLVIE